LPVNRAGGIAGANPGKLQGVVLRAPISIGRQRTQAVEQVLQRLEHSSMMAWAA